MSTDMTAEQWEREAQGDDRAPPATPRAGDEAAVLLRQILAGQAAMVAKLDAVIATQAKHEQLIVRIGMRLKSIDERGGGAPAQPQPGPRSDPRRGEYGKPAASGRDLDGQHGNPTIKKDPPRWSGESCVGRRFSECPAEYLAEIAGFLDWKADKNLEDAGKANTKDEADKLRKYADYARKDAARARGWAERNEGTPPQQPRAASQPSNDESNVWT